MILRLEIPGLERSGRGQLPLDQIMSELILPLLVLLGSALLGDLIGESIVTNPHSNSRSIALGSWVGASLFTGSVCFIAAVSLGGLYFVVNPLPFLVHAPLIGGIGGAIVDIPLRIFRGRRQRRSWKLIGLEILWIGVTLLVMLVSVVIFHMVYKPASLPV